MNVIRKAVPVLLALAVMAGALVQTRQPALAGGVPQVPVPGMVTMLDLGAKSCIPCKMMAPILKEMEKRYQGRAAVIFIDVRENMDQVDRFGIRAIPTQIFYDADGREVLRHTGFMDKAAIIKVFDSLGIK